LAGAVAHLERENEEMMWELEHVRSQMETMDRSEESQYGSLRFGFGVLAGFSLAASVGWVALKNASQVATRRSDVLMQMSEEPSRSTNVSMQAPADVEAPPQIDAPPRIQPPPAPPTLQPPPAVATGVSGAVSGGATTISLTQTPALPKIKTFMVGDGTLAGDMNFDPMGLAESPEDLAWQREAEIKHARLAMLAAVGWPLSEIFNFGGLLTEDGRAPALLNDGLEKVNAAYWAAVIIFSVVIESRVLEKQYGWGKRADDYLPGDLGFDPLGRDSPSMRSAEIWNGRVAMLAITAFAYEEFFTKAAIFPISLFK
jgi:hypothetical protein